MRPASTPAVIWGEICMDLKLGFNNVLKVLAGVAFGVSSIGTAFANPIINIEYAPGVSFSAADKATIQSAINFYTSNITNNFTLTIAFGALGPGGGAQSTWFPTTGISYNAYYNALAAESSPSDATRQAALASLGGGAHTINPVTGTSTIGMESTLAAMLGLAPQVSDSFSGCGGLTANACIQISSSDLNATGSPVAALFGEVEHETDEVLGTSSALPNGGTGGVPSDPFASDLYRYSSPGVRSFALNPSTDVPCTGSPTAYFSVNGGATNLDQYNNCNNGGDYGDWIYDDGAQVQDAFGPSDVAASLNLNSPEVALLDADGYNFATSTVPEPSSFALIVMGLAIGPLALRKRAHRRQIAIRSARV